MQNKSSENNNIMNMPVTKSGTNVKQITPEPPMSFDQLCECMTNFFDDREFEVKQGFKKGFSCVVGEDYSNIDLLINMMDIVYNYCNNNEKISKAEKVNLKNLCTGVHQVIKSMEQYNITTQMNKDLISTLMGYTLKITRNYFHDRN